jgi:hypothetical protein
MKRTVHQTGPTSSVKKLFGAKATGWESPATILDAAVDTNQAHQHGDIATASTIYGG